MKLLLAFAVWVFMMFVEIIWMLNNASGGSTIKEKIYVIMVISLVVGVTGLNLYSRHYKK
jgi:hypothetical protein